MRGEDGTRAGDTVAGASEGHDTAAHDPAAHEPYFPRPKSPSDSGSAEADVLTDVWGAAEPAPAEVDFGPVKVCRNARGFSFDGLADDRDDGDLVASWRRLLEREGKASADGESLRSLVLGPSADG